MNIPITLIQISNFPGQVIGAPEGFELRPDAVRKNESPFPQHKFVFAKYPTKQQLGSNSGSFGKHF